jgi:hypothetical protein
MDANKTKLNLSQKVAVFAKFWRHRNFGKNRFFVGIWLQKSPFSGEP